jgi:hypothetical protein
MVDRVCCYDMESKSETIVGWAAVVESLGDAVTPWEKAPACYQVKGFPTAEQLANMVRS